MVSAFNISEDAYLTILLHAAKYPSCTVCGVLLGQVQSGSSKPLTVITAVPLFHISMLLAPCVETALAQIEAHAGQRSLKLIGYYHSEARFDANDINPVGKRIADRIAERQPEAFAVFLNNQKLQQFSRAGSSEPPFELLLRENTAGGGPKPGSWKKVPDGSTASGLGIAGNQSSGSGGSWEELRARFLNLHNKGVHQQLADFDEHLDDISKDYLNTDLLGGATAVLAK